MTRPPFFRRARRSPRGLAPSSATFKTVAGGAKTLTATDTVTGTITGSEPGISVTPAAATQLAFTPASPGPVAAGSTIPNVAVSVEDAYGNVVTAATGSVVMSIKSGSPQSSFTSGTLTIPLSSGVATFPNLVVDTAGSYTFTATPSGIAGVTTAVNSSAFTVTASTATKLVWDVQPVGGVTEGTNFATQPVVYVEDAYGNVVTNNASSVTLAINGYTAGNGGTNQGSLGCTALTVTASAGVATFAGCKITGTAAAGTYTLTATDGSLTAAPASSNVSVIAGAATQLVFTPATPGPGVAGTVIPNVEVSVEDANGNVVTAATGSVVLSIKSGGPQSSFTSGTSTITLSSGVANFTNLVVDTAGSYTFTATPSGISGVTTAVNSSAFTVTASTATKLVWDVQPVGGVTEGTNFATQPKIYVEDAYGNVVTSDTSSVTLAINGYTAGNGGTNQGTLGCTALTVSAASGVATFAGCQITGTAAAGTYTLTASDGSLTAAPASSAVSITYGTATQLVWDVQPVGGVTEGTNFATQPVVYVEDANGNVVTNNASSVTLAINGYTAGNGGTTSGTLGCTALTVTASAGVATFAGCKITGTAAAGTYTLTATDGSLTAAPASSNVSVIAGAATQLVFTPATPGPGVAGTVIPNVEVSVEDANGNVVTAATGSVVLSIKSGGPQSSFTSGTSTITLSSGVANFTNLVVDTAGSYTFTATPSGISGVTTAVNSSAFTVTASTATKLVWDVQPVGGVTEGTNFATQPKIYVEDAYGNVVTSDTSSVTLAINGYTAGNGGTNQGTLGCTALTVSAASGVATFAGCQITGTAAAGTYTLTASDGSLTAAPASSAVSITYGTATQLVWDVQPVGGVTEGTNFATQPVVYVEDANGNVVTNNASSVTLAINGYTAGNGGTTSGTLGCTALTVTASAGVATFAGCQITGTAAAGTYTLKATDGTLTAAPASSNVSVIAGTASKLAWDVQPVGGVTEGTNFATQPVIYVEDANGNVVTSDTSSVTLAINGYTAGNGGTTQGSLGCTALTVTAVAGVATFAGCQITGTAAAGTYTLKATDGSLTAAPASSSVSINYGTATKLAWDVQPVGGVTEGTSFGTQPKIYVEDANGNVVTNNASSVTLAISGYTAGNGGTNQGTLGCTALTVTASAGVATFAACQITGTAAAGTYTLTASDGSLTAAPASSAVSITYGTATKLAWDVQPVGGVTEGTNFATQPVIYVEDANGNVVTNNASSVTLAINGYTAGNGGTTQGTLGCTALTVTASSGVATFAGCQITGTAGAGTYTLKATDGSLTAAPASSNVSVIASTASKLVWDVQPVGGVTEGTNFATQPVIYVEDAYGNVVTSDTSSVTLAINGYTAGNGGTNQGSLGCTALTVTASAGVATFAGCQITGTAAAGTYTLTASDGSLTAAPASSAVSITYGTATKLAWDVQPVGGVTEGTNFATQPVVYVEDANGNVVTNNASSVTLALNGYTAGNGGTTSGTLGCTALTVTASAGVATFAACKITGTAAAGTYTLKATDGTLTAAPASSNVSVIAGTASKLAWDVQPVGGVTEGTNFATQPVIYVEDANGNVVTSDTSSVTLAINGYTAGNGGTTQGTLGCTALTVTAVAGVATFAGCQITGTAAAGTYTLKATDGSLTAAPASSSVSINYGTATKLGWDVQPVGGVTEGTSFATQPKIYVEDAYGNVVTNNTTVVTLALNGYTAGNGGTTEGTLGCTALAVTASAGVATFAACKITGTAADGSYTLTASDSSLTSAPASSAVSIIAGAASKLAFTPAAPGPGTHGSSIPNVAVSVEDANGNVVTTATGSVVISIKSGCPQTSFTSGTTTITLSSGVATFNNLVVTATGSYTFTATPSGISGVTTAVNSSAFTVS